jgi:hypothetical protein
VFFNASSCRGAARQVYELTLGGEDLAAAIKP